MSVSARNDETNRIDENFASWTFHLKIGFKGEGITNDTEPVAFGHSSHLGNRVTELTSFFQLSSQNRSSGDLPEPEGS